MLVLSRKLGEKIVIGDNIVITVVKIDRNQVRIGVDAPDEVDVYRREIMPAGHPQALPTPPDRGTVEEKRATGLPFGNRGGLVRRRHPQE